MRSAISIAKRREKEKVSSSRYNVLCLVIENNGKFEVVLVYSEDFLILFLHNG